MAAWLRRRSPLDITLNLVFVAWLLYFIITGYFIPAPLHRAAANPPPAIESHDGDLPALPAVEKPDA
jgi:hypothetical protein